jgi:hypothetical protein
MGQLAQIDIMKAKALMDMNMPTRKEFQQEVYLKQIDGASNLNMKFREDRKDDRTKIQAGQQSKLIDQRSKDKEPLDFENDFNFEEMMG